MITTLDEFTALVGRYEAVALIGNSEALDIDAVVARLPENTLFVFFTGCAKVLSRPFPRDAMMCHRLIRNGTAFLKSRRTFDQAYGFFPQGLKAEIGILADKAPAADAAPASKPRTSPLTAVTLDFDHALGTFYPVGRMPTTGFAVAMWILGEMPEARLWLCGFTGVAGLEFQLYTEHDWTFEQTVLQLFVRSGRLVRFEEALQTEALDRVTRRFPEFTPGEVALVASEVLARRFTGMERQMAKLWGMTKVPRKIRGFLKRFGRG